MCGLMLVWPWLAAFGLCVASLFLPAESVQKAWALPLYTNVAIPVAVLGWLVCGFADVAKSTQVPPGADAHLAFPRHPR